MPPARWPLHPAPLDGEALSSWLRRIAAAYQMSWWEFLEHGVRHEHLTEHALDLAPPPSLQAILVERTGIDPNRLHQMSRAGWTPWLQDSLEAEPSAFDTYVHQFSVLLKHGKRAQHPVSRWLAWTADDPVQRACPRCLKDPDRQGMLLMWQLPLLLSCPEHRCMLEPCYGFPGDYLVWTSGNAPSRVASEAVVDMDHRTQQALTTGRVQLPRRIVHAGVWFRLLRTLLDELSSSLSCWGARSSELRLAWANCGHEVRAGQARWRPFEAFPWPVQAQLLEAAAGTIDLLATGILTGKGAHAGLFLPTPQVAVYEGRPRLPPPPRMEECNPWVLAMAALEEAVRAARDRPADAQTLYNLAVIGCRTPESVDQLRAVFTRLDIPTENLSYNMEAATFA